MELCSLHPFDETRAHDLVAAISGVSSIADRDSWERATIDRARSALERAGQGQSRAVSELTYAFALLLADAEPCFAHTGLSLTGWEARIDRGVGMLMRPPARLFIDGGMEPAIARQAPTRLELSAGMMGGAFIPARLIPELQKLLDTRLERTIRRLIDAEYDAIPLMALMMEAADYAATRNQGLFEAMDIADRSGLVEAPRGRVIAADPKRLDKALRMRLAEAAKPPKKPGLFSRLLGRRQDAGHANGGGSSDGV